MLDALARKYTDFLLKPYAVGSQLYILLTSAPVRGLQNEANVVHPLLDEVISHTSLLSYFKFRGALKWPHIPNETLMIQAKPPPAPPKKNIMPTHLGSSRASTGFRHQIAKGRLKLPKCPVEKQRWKSGGEPLKPQSWQLCTTWDEAAWCRSNKMHHLVAKNDPKGTLYKSELLNSSIAGHLQHTLVQWGHDLDLLKNPLKISKTFET